MGTEMLLKAGVMFGRVLCMGAMIGTLAAGVGTEAASAVRPAPLIQFPGDGAAGSEAGRMQIPRGITASPVNGHLYVVDALNERIDEFTAWGVFVRAFGWDVVASGSGNTGASFEICEAVAGDVCKAGISGAGAGQIGNFSPAGGIDVDAVTGDVYATDMGANHRVQKFDAEGNFLLMFGGEVNKTTGADVCTRADIEGGDVCGAGVLGAGDSEFLAQEFGSYLTVSPDGNTVYVGDKERIQEFAPDGTFKGQIPFSSLQEELPSFPEETHALGLAADPVSGDLYLIVGTPDVLFRSVDKRVFRLDPESGELLDILEAPTLNRPAALAVDSDGNLFVTNAAPRAIVKFDASGTTLIPDAAEEGEGEAFGAPLESDVQLTGIATNSACGSESDDIYVTYSRQANGPVSALAYVNSFGPPPQDAVKCPPPPAEVPEIAAQYATAVGTDSASLQAEISPGYDVDTTFFVQYGTGKCSEGGCTQEKPLGPGTKLTSTIAKAALKSSPIVLSGLQEATTYHYRFVAANSAGTVRGVGGTVGSDGAEASFTTFPAPGKAKEDCPNQIYRRGPSARLADCRAYEMVSPAHRSPAGDVVVGLTPLEFPAELTQSSTDGEKLAYSSEFAFGDAAGGPISNEYIATRHAGVGWSTHAISPPRSSKLINDNAAIKKDIEEKAFTADLCSSWLMHNTDPPLSGNAVPGFPNIYRRENCGAAADSYDAITTAAPTSTPAENYWPEVQGFSADGARTVFRGGGGLTADAPNLPSGTLQLYMNSEGTLRFICRLPDGSALAAACSAGTLNFPNSDGRFNRVENAVSEDGRRVYWSNSSVTEVGGLLYLRENADQEQSAMDAGKCAEPGKACSFKVSNEPARFWTAAEDGSLALFTEGERLREFDATTKKAKTIAEEVEGVAGASQDLSTYYFVSSEVIGGEGEEGSPNLYRRAEGTVSLAATLAEIDTEGQSLLPLSPAAPRPGGRGARITGDGEHLVFASAGSLTGYDNRDAATGVPASELYLHDAGAAGPVCISCNPSGARPAGRTLPLSEANRTRTVAAMLATAQNQLHTPRAITEDGNRIFFNSFDSLVARDTNGKSDVYEWERSASAQRCSELGADLYVASSGGCLSLISSGTGAEDSTFVDMSIENGARDVFFKTAASLVPEDPGLIDIYDAREGGGLPEPIRRPPCEGEACQSPPPPPSEPTPSSLTYEGPEEKKGKPPCPKGKHRVKGKCVKKKKQQKKKHGKKAKKSARADKGGAR